MSEETGRAPVVRLHDEVTGGKPIVAEELRAEVRAWAARIGVAPREVHIRPLKRKWASCSSRGRLTFDEGLLGEPAAFRREVIVHELLHLKVPNHGRLFRALLRAYLAEPPLS